MIEERLLKGRKVLVAILVGPPGWRGAEFLRRNFLQELEWKRAFDVEMRFRFRQCLDKRRHAWVGTIGHGSMLADLPIDLVTTYKWFFMYFCVHFETPAPRANERRRPGES